VRGDSQVFCIHCCAAFDRPADLPPWEAAQACERPVCQRRQREWRAELAAQEKRLALAETERHVTRAIRRGKRKLASAEEIRDFRLT